MKRPVLARRYAADRAPRPNPISGVATAIPAMAVFVILALATIAAACSASVEMGSDGDDEAAETETTPADSVERATPGGDDAGAEATGADDPQADTAVDETTTRTDDELETARAPEPAEVFAEIADSIVFIEAGDSTGTGIIIDGGWVLTNAHVVERLAEVRLGRYDGEDLGQHRVHGSDWLFDLALIGPVDEPSLDAISWGDSSELAIGDGIMLVGFPDESNAAPTPTLTSGIVSRRRQPVLGDYPFLQVDATIAPGQSGGALIDMAGNLVGISGLEFGAGEFGLALEADAMRARVDRLQATPASDPFPATNQVFRLSSEVGPRRSLGFVVEVGSDNAIQMLAQAEADIFIDVRTRSGFTYTDPTSPGDPFVSSTDSEARSYFIDDLVIGGEELIGTLPPGEYEVIIGTFSAEPVVVQVTSDNALRQFIDAEEAAPLPIGDLVEGEIDWSGDSDRWELELQAGDQVTITADGIADTLLAVRLDGQVIGSSDDEQIGMFGTAAQVAFVAPESGVYEVEVGSFDTARWGYLIEVLID